LQEGVAGACAHTSIPSRIIVLGVGRGRLTGCAYCRLVPALPTGGGAGQAGSRLQIHVIARGASAHAGRSEGVVVCVGNRTSGYRAICPRVADGAVRVAVADTPGAYTILRAPVGADFPGVDTKIIKVRAFETTLHASHCLTGTLFTSKTEHRVYSHREGNTRCVIIT